MQGYNIDESKLIVSWNRYEQGLMKAHLMKCLNDDINCFGNQKEVAELHYMLAKHGVLPPRNYNNPNFQQLVGDIKYAIQQHLQNYNGNQFSGAQWYYINNNNETDFLTRFAMAIQDTKIRGTFVPEGQQLQKGQSLNNQTLFSFLDTYKNQTVANTVTFAKAKLLSLATQLTRIGLNCQTTVHNSNNLRNAAQNAGVKTINFIDTNNFLGKGALRMDQLGIGMNPPQYYFNLYRKLFDFALKREWDRRQNNQMQKIPRFLIPLTGYWGTPINAPTYGKCVDMNIHIKQALEKLFSTKYNASQTYGDLIAVDIVDFNNANSGLFKNWQYGRVLNKNSNIDLFNNPQYEDYAIGSGDHYTFIGNECMDCWQNPNTGSHEAFAMKTDFPKFYNQNQGFAPNGYYIITPNLFQMPTDYQLHMNYQNDIIVPMNGINKGINYNTQYGTNNFYSQHNNKNYFFS